MTDYPINVKIDPANAVAGNARVKAALTETANTATALGAAIKSSLDISKFNEYAAAASSAAAGDKARAVAATDAMRASDLYTLSAVKFGDAQRKATTATEAGTRATKEAAVSQAQLDASLRRVLEATDEEALALLKMNKLVAEAKTLFDNGKISVEQYAKVQQLAATAAKGHTNSLAQQRNSSLILGEQFRQFATEVQLGISPVQAFAQQAGQGAFALQGFGGAAGKVGAFLASGWGTLVIVATTVLLSFVDELIKSGNELENNIDKLKKDAEATETNRRAKEKFKTTEEGVTAAIREQAEAYKNSIDAEQGSAERANIEAQNNLAREISIRKVTQALLDQAVARYNIDKQRASGPGTRDTIALTADQDARQVAGLQKKLDDTAASIATAQQNLTNSRVDLAAEAGVRAADPVQQINKRYDDQIKLLKEAARATKELTRAQADALGVQIRTLEIRRQAELDRYQESQRNTPKGPGDGVARFRSREQAIGIAGRELQGEGLRVSENNQFGGVTGGHKDPNHAKYDIDVNFGTGVTEANVPDLKARFDGAARRYQSRGYRVLWNGQVYSPFGNGPSGPITGADKHYDHMHLEAPATIVGKPTQAGVESAANREVRVEDQQADFVQGIVDQASTRGQPDAAASLRARIDAVFAEYKKRFNTALDRNSPEGKRITGALTDAEARTEADHFQTAYVDPLKRLQDLQGKTGLDRQVLNQQLAETARLGRELTPIERQQIDASVRQGDALTREAQILEEVQRPLEEYAAALKTINDLLKQGKISQVEYNRRLSDLQGPARALVQGVSGRLPGGRRTSNLGASLDETARYRTELAELEKNRKGLLALGVNYDRLVEKAAKQHAANMIKIDHSTRDMRLSLAQQAADSLYSITSDLFGKQSTAARIAFGIEKGLTVARAALAMYDDVAQAMKVGFPQNIPLIAEAFAQGAIIISAVKSVAAPQGYADGGMIYGPGGPRQDAIPMYGSNGEFMVNADATAKNRAVLEAINNGAVVGEGRRAQTQGAAVAAANARSRVTVVQHPGVAIDVQENLTTGDVEFIAKRAVQKHAPTVIAADLNRPNSRTSKAITTTTTARGRKK